MKMNKAKYQIGDIVFGWKVKRVWYSKEWKTDVYQLTKRNNKLSCDEQFLIDFLLYNKTSDDYLTA